MKKISLALAALVLCSMFQSPVSAAPKDTGTKAPPVIDIEPEQCVTRCFFIMGVPVYCYEMCF